MGGWEEKLNQILSSPQAMEQIMALANSIAGSAGQGDSSAASAGEAAQAPAPVSEDGGGLGALLSGLDPGAMGKVLELFSVYQQGGDEKDQLLSALRPFLRPERQARLEQALRITRLSRVIRAAMGMVQGERHV